mgnify:CR=1 FL=1
MRAIVIVALLTLVACTKQPEKGAEGYEHDFMLNGETYTCYGTTKECEDIAERCRTGKQKCPPISAESSR